ncbi:MAG: hypothetical protein N2111_01355 [Candidatus Sumerlaeaceae bacterium]|nr:hypothetical protein [Candidatus Sumerlaeaceae bacterium]
MMKCKTHRTGWLLVTFAAMLLLSGCSTVGSAIDGTGRALSKAGRSVKNL